MSPISDILVTAFESYQTGDFHRSELLCRQILQEQPDSTEALHILGTIAHQQGRLDEASEPAIAHYQQSLAAKKYLCKTMHDTPSRGITTSCRIFTDLSKLPIRIVNSRSKLHPIEENSRPVLSVTWSRL